MKLLSRDALWALGATALTWAVPAVAVLMVITVLIPAKVWHQPVNDAVFEGFDAKLIHVSETGNGDSPGIVQVSQDSLTLTTLPNSQPTVHLATTPMSFKASMDVRIMGNGKGTTPLRVGLWDPRSRGGHFLNFGPAPQNLVTAETVVNGRAGNTLIGGDVIKSDTLGRYSLGQSFHLEIERDRKGSNVISRLSSSERPPSGGPMLKVLADTDALQDILSNPISVQGGTEYSFGGQAKLFRGEGLFAIGVLWWDQAGKRLPFANYWKSTAELTGWTEIRLTETSPAEATTGRVFVGAAEQAHLLFADISMMDTARPDRNLLLNGDFESGLEGWRNVSAPQTEMEVIEPFSLAVEYVVTEEEAPEVVRPFRPSLTVSASSVAGSATTVVENYTLTLPSQRFPVNKIDDGRARSLVIVLLAAGALLCVFGIARWVWRAQPGIALASRSLSEWVERPLVIRRWPFLLGAGIVVLVYLVLNSFLFSFGSPLYDVLVAKTWSYISAEYGLLELYKLAPVVTSAEISQGIPWTNSAFPYGLTKVYYYLSIGLLDRLFLSGPGGLAVGAFGMEFLTKFFNVMFGLADGLLIYLIVRRMGARPRLALIPPALFLFNPVTWFTMSIWGSTENVSLFFILASVWLAEKRQPVWAWLALGAGAFTRIQMIVPAFLLSVVFLRKFSVKQNVASLSWCVIVFYLFLGPLALEISPSLPAYHFYTIVLNHAIGGEDSTVNRAISPGHYSVWTLPLFFINDESGRTRMWHPSEEPLIGPLSYGETSALLVIGFLLLTGAVLLFRRNLSMSASDYLPIVAVGVLGWLILSTGLISRYFLYGLLFVILTRSSWQGSGYYVVVFIMSVTALVTTWGHFGLDILGNRNLEHAMHPDNDPTTRFFKNLFLANWFITLGTILNIFALVRLTIEVIRPPAPSWWRRRKRHLANLAPAGKPSSPSS